MANSNFGFVNASELGSRSRLVMSVEALPGQGKTHFGLSLPGPVCFINLDDGHEGVIEKFIPAKEIKVLNLEVPDMLSSRDEDELNEAAAKEARLLIKKEAGVEWKKFTDGYYGALKAPNSYCRSVFIDTATELRELQLMSYFGKATQIMPHMYRGPNSEFRRIIRDSLKYDKNVVFAHKMKPLYIDDKRTKNYELAGFNDTPYDVQVSIQLYFYEDGTPAMFINKCRPNIALINEELTGEMCTFAMLAAMVLPDVDVENWE